MNQKALCVRTEQWRRIVRECINRDPKISKRQWCLENSIRYRSLMYWQQKFQKEALAVTVINDHGNSLPVQSGSVNAPAFADMTAQLETLRTEQCPPAEQETLMPEPELMIQAGSYRIYVSSSLHESTLETVMRCLGTASAFPALSYAAGGSISGKGSRVLQHMSS